MKANYELIRVKNHVSNIQCILYVYKQGQFELEPVPYLIRKTLTQTTDNIYDTVRGLIISQKDNSRISGLV